MENKKPKTKRWNRWEKEEKKPVYRELTREEKEKLRQQQQEEIRHASEGKPQKQPTPRWEPRGWEPRKLNKEVIAKLVAWHLRQDEQLKKLAEKVTHKLLLKILPELTERVLTQAVEVIHREVLKGATVEIRKLATWRTSKGKIKIKNHIKPKKTP